MKQFLLFFIILLVYASSAFAAKLQGTVYGVSLEEIKNAKIEINTTPKQIFIARNSTYKINVPVGFYEINATYSGKFGEMSTKEQITIKDDEDYVLDLILFPDIEEGIEDINVEIGRDIIENKNKIFSLNKAIILLIAIFIAIMSAVYLIKFRKNKNVKKAETWHEDHNLEQIVRIIREEGGRATQKDIRKKMPYSEAKISLMIAELESKGTISKIKKGRGNIIILNK